MRLPQLIVKRNNGERMLCLPPRETVWVTSDSSCHKKYDPVYKFRRVACYAVKRDSHMHKHFRD